MQYGAEKEICFFISSFFLALSCWIAIKTQIPANRERDFSPKSNWTAEYHGGNQLLNMLKQLSFHKMLSHKLLVYNPHWLVSCTKPKLMALQPGSPNPGCSPLPGCGLFGTRLHKWWAGAHMHVRSSTYASGMPLCTCVRTCMCQFPSFPHQASKL